MTAAPLFTLELSDFTPGAKLAAKGSFKGIGFGGHATVAKFEPNHLELDVRAQKLVFSFDVKLRFVRDAQGNADFWGGLPSGKTFAGEPTHVKHVMTVREQSPEQTVFEFPFEEKGKRVMKTVSVVKAGPQALRIVYDSVELTLSLAR
ncbi:MAG: hypothetical protein IPJ65_30615 [Archangiaceae bacterium]|nr:hypothetical protein [Archangiaceae bacterium]